MSRGSGIYYVDDKGVRGYKKRWSFKKLSISYPGLLMYREIRQKVIFTFSKIELCIAEISCLSRGYSAISRQSCVLS